MSGVGTLQTGQVWGPVFAFIIHYTIDGVNVRHWIHLILSKTIQKTRLSILFCIVLLARNTESKQILANKYILLKKILNNLLHS